MMKLCTSPRVFPALVKNGDLRNYIPYAAIAFMNKAELPKLKYLRPFLLLGVSWKTWNNFLSMPRKRETRQLCKIDLTCWKFWCLSTLGIFLLCFFIPFFSSLFFILLSIIFGILASLYHHTEVLNAWIIPFKNSNDTRDVWEFK